MDFNRNLSSQEGVNDILKVLKKENCQLRILCSAKLSFKK
jgi:hypothetical protein